MRLSARSPLSVGQSETVTPGTDLAMVLLPLGQVV
jgi:hypothetical protein